MKGIASNLSVPPTPDLERLRLGEIQTDLKRARKTYVKAVSGFLARETQASSLEKDFGKKLYCCC